MPLARRASRRSAVAYGHRRACAPTSLAHSGGDTVYFGAAAPFLERRRGRCSAGAGDVASAASGSLGQDRGPCRAGDTRDHALAIGARRAEEVRNYLVLLGVPAAQLSATSWGKERPGAGRARDCAGALT